MDLLFPLIIKENHNEPVVEVEVVPYIYIRIYKSR